METVKALCIPASCHWVICHRCSHESAAQSSPIWRAFSTQSTHRSQEPRKDKKPLGPTLCLRALQEVEGPYPVPLDPWFRSNSNRFLCFLST